MSFLVNPYSYATGCADADALAFLAAAGITDATITSAICTLVTTMKADGTWAKCSAIYPMVGGTATTHKFNLKNPADTNAAFRLVFSGGWTHSANGALPNGSNSFANTFVLPSTAFSSNQNINISYYSRTSNNTTGYEFGVSYDNFSARFGLIARYFNLNSAYAFFGANVAGTNPDSRGFYSANSVSSGVQVVKNGSVLTTGAVATTNLALFTGTNTVVLAAERRNGVPIEYSSKECAFASLGSGLTATELVNYYNSVQAFNTTLSRQV
jgi:hypothetical protein